MRSNILSLAATAISLGVGVKGQTYTSCNPTTNTSCPSDAALGTTQTIDFTSGASSFFTADDGTSITYDSTNGAEFVITSDGLAQTITSNKYIFFGKVSVVLRAANGTGIVSSFVMESDDLDEIDWEWLGGDTTQVETNYFGKGNTTTYDRATYETVATPQDEFHTYTIDWTSASIKWHVDDVLVRTLLYSDALSGKNYPQTPMMIKIGNWVGGAADASEGTVEWAGGYTDLDDAPFTMYVKSVTVEDYSTGATKYTYGDMTGDYTSIVITTGSNSTTASSSSSSSSSSSNGTTTTSYSTNSTVSGSSSSSSSASSSSNASSTGSSASASSSTVLISGAGSLTRCGALLSGVFAVAFALL
ncbi:concanavalin A-like lectin/glucanase domain-containing protein [Tricladium varicosporioides]|nr:concanavalin A-like lectin/glucanase domain-containing protein [Hymenoscyphus varicosporioides]